MEKRKTFKIITFGCRVNQAESRQMGETLAGFGLKEEQEKNKADVIIVNTCTITHKADREVRKELRRIKRENKNSCLIVVGCWVEKINKDKQKDRKKQEIMKTTDLVLTNSQKQNLVQVLLRKKILLRKQEKKRDYKDKYARDKKAIIKVQDGCNNFCTYCIVPYVRGRSKSKQISQILKEIKQKQKEGIKEVILTGVDLADFKTVTKKNNKERKGEHKHKVNHLAFLLKEILTKTDIEKISFGSINLKAFTNEFFNLYKQEQNKEKEEKIKNPKRKKENKKEIQRLSAHFHIPLQSGSNQTLKRMGRRYTKKQFLKKIIEINENIKNFTFSTDLIVGFPGETEKEFKQTLETLKEIKQQLGERFKHIHTFRYSKRQGTVASSQEFKWGRVREEMKKNRVKQLKEIIRWRV